MAISPGVFVASVLICLCVGLVVGYLAGKAAHSRDGGIAAGDLAQLQSHAAAATARAQRLEEENNALIDRARTDQNLLRAIAPIAHQVDEITSRVQGLTEAQVAQRAELHEQMETVGRTQAGLAAETSALRATLSSSSARGTWGEVELQRIVEAAGMLTHVDFSTQLTTAKLSSSGSASRPDLTVHLPGGGHLAIDAKVPLTALLHAQEVAGTGAPANTERQRLLAEHAKAVRGHVTALAKRNYPADFPGSPRVTVMFLPTESLLSEALSTDPTLLEDALRLGVAPTSPSSLLALLRAVASVWSSAHVAEQAEEIAALGTTLIDRLTVVASHLDSLGNSLRSSVRHYNKVVGSLESRVLVTARDFSALDRTVKSPAPISSDDAQVRQIVASELTENQQLGASASHEPYGDGPDERPSL